MKGETPVCHCPLMIGPNVMSAAEILRWGKFSTPCTSMSMVDLGLERFVLRTWLLCTSGGEYGIFISTALHLPSSWLLARLSHIPTQQSNPGIDSQCATTHCCQLSENGERARR